MTVDFGPKGSRSSIVEEQKERGVIREARQRGQVWKDYQGRSNKEAIDQYTLTISINMRDFFTINGGGILL